jgi:hypothetical protein
MRALLRTCIVVINGMLQGWWQQSELEWGARWNISSLLRWCKVIRMGGTVHVVLVGTRGHGHNDRRGGNFGPAMTGGDSAVAGPGHVRATSWPGGVGLGPI